MFLFSDHKWATALAICTFFAAGAAAQTNSTEYCYGSVCGTQKQAEDAMRSAYPNFAPYFTQKDKSVGFVNGNLTTLYITYTVPDQPPASMNQPVYGPDFGNPPPEYCAPSGDPIYPRACNNDQDVVRGFVNFYVNIYGADRVTHTVEGGYFSPFAEASGFGSPPAGEPPRGWLQHNNQRTAVPKQKTVTVTVFRADGTIASGHGGTVRIFKFTSYTCPAGFVANSGAHPSYNPTALKLLTAPTCSATIYDQTITTRLRQNAPPPEMCKLGAAAGGAEGKNPCYPATGDKARFETDFEFAGRSFTRTYHSLRQVGQLPELAPGWVHSYSDRISGSPSSLSSPLLWTNDDGYLEIFRRVGSTNRFVSEGNANKILDVEPTNTLAHKYIVTDASGQVRYFNAAGRLIRIEDRGSAWKINFGYEADRLITATDYLGRQLQFNYQNNRLVSIRLPDGNIVTYGYDANRNFQSVQYADATTRSYHYNEAGYSDANDPHALSGISINAERYATFAYDSKGRVRLSQLHTNEGLVEKIQLSYIGDTQVTVTGHNGETRNYTISGTSGYRRVVSVAASDGTTSNTYTGARTFESRDKRQNVTRYEYTADGAYQNARYDAFGTQEERKTVMERNAEYRLTSMQTQAKVGATYVAKQTQGWTYNARGQTLTATTTDPTTAYARTTTTSYCEASDVTAGSCPIVGLITAIDGPRTDVSDVTTYSYYNNDASGCAVPTNTCAYRKGDLRKVRNALLQETQYAKYDNAGRLLTMLDANSIATDLEYDARGRLIARKVRGSNNAMESDDQITRIEYWPNGLVKKVTQPNGAFTSYIYDGAQRLVGIADNAGNSMTYTLNAAGERIKEDTKDSSGAMMRTLARTYNLLGQLQAQTDAYNRSTAFSYDANSNLDTTTDPLTRVSDNNYDPLNRLSRTLQDVSGIAAETKFSYDALDNLTQVNDPKGLNTTYSYNGLSDLTQLASPDTGTTSYLYDSAGNRVSQTDARGVITNHSYDVLNRLTSTTYPTTSLNVSYEYDTDVAGVCAAAGENFLKARLVQVTDGSGSTQYCYDRFGNMTRKIQRTNGKTFTVRYLYAANGRLNGVIYPDGSVIDYVRDAQARIVEIGAKAASGTRQVLLNAASYHAFGPIARWSYGNTRPMQRKLNANYQPESIETAAGGLSLGYEFDEVGNLKKLRNAVPASTPLRVYNYDALNRLTQTMDAAGAILEGYTYDKTGNRTSMSKRVEVPAGPGVGSGTFTLNTTAYGYGGTSHRLSSVGGTTRSYDAAGNQTLLGDTLQPGGPNALFTYNDQGRMSSVQARGGVLQNYAYNGRGEQVQKYTSSTANVYSVYDEAGHWLGDYDDSGAPTQQVIWFDDLPVGLWTGSGRTQTLYYLEADALGTPRAVVDPSRGTLGTVVWSWDLTGEAFGNAAPKQDPDNDARDFVFNMRFPGQRFDSVSGLNYNYFRDYDAGTGRYVESDPIGLEGGIGTYAYVGNTPFTALDTYGLQGVPNVLPPRVIQHNRWTDPHRQFQREFRPELIDPRTGLYPRVTPQPRCTLFCPNNENECKKKPDEPMVSATLIFPSGNLLGQSLVGCYCLTGPGMGEARPLLPFDVSPPETPGPREAGQADWMRLIRMILTRRSQ
jgi:RHS repeat-associated protein